jgi:hypothetical protein
VGRRMRIGGGSGVVWGIYWVLTFFGLGFGAFLVS